jgi:hypothetical protein
MNSAEKTEAKQLPIYAFLTGSGISYTGDVLTLLAIPWFVLQTTSSIEQTGLTALATSVRALLAILPVR